MFTNRTRPTTCPVCYGEGGEVTWRHTGMYGAYGPEPREDFEPCEACAGQGTVERMEALAFAIGEERRRESALPPCRLPADWAVVGLEVVV